MQKGISMRAEQFNELIDLFRKISSLIREAAMTTEAAFRLMPSSRKAGRACVCKIAGDLGKAWDIFFQISDLLENAKTTNESENND